MQWQDSGIILKHRPYSEKYLITSVFTQEKGLANGLISRSKTLFPQPGDFVLCTFQARLETQLGRLKLENQKSHAFLQFSHVSILYVLHSMLEILSMTLAEHHPYPNLWGKVKQTIENLSSQNPFKAYCFFELFLLEDLGFGLSLKSCTLTGKTRDLAFVSPKTGCAVTKEAAMPYEKKLLKLPPFLTDSAINLIDDKDFFDALNLTGYFLSKHLLNAKNIPYARQELIQLLRSSISAPSGMLASY